MDIVNCNDCHNENCKVRGKNNRTMCWAYKERPQPITNADRIRSMTDEELAKTLSDVGHGNCVRGGILPCDGESCYTCWLNWLRREVKTDA